MPTNEERREVAARLRRLASHKAADEESTLDALGLYRGENIEGYDTYGVMHLADLIEPEPERTLSEKDALAVVYEHICGDGYDAEGRAKSIIHELAKMCGAKVVGE